MRAFKLNVDSWHYKLASNFGYDPDFKDHDICVYLRRVMLGFVVSAIIFAMGIGVTILASLLLTNLVLGPWFYFMYGLPFNEIAFVAWLVVVVGGFVFGVTKAVQAIKEWHYAKVRAQYELENAEDYVPPEDGFLKLAYRAWKNKFCARLEFVSADGQKYETERQIRDRYWREQYERDLQAVRDAEAGEQTTGSAP